MRYLAVQWHHNLADEPIRIYSEIDDGRWEQRKVEVYANGTHDWAEAEESTGATRLSTEVLPTLEEIADDPQFAPREISRDEFEAVWRKATGHAA